MMKNKTAGRGYVRKTCNYCNRMSGYRSYRKKKKSPYQGAVRWN